VNFERSRPSGQPELVEEKEWTTETSTVEWRTEVGTEEGSSPRPSSSESVAALFGRFMGGAPDRVVSSHSSSSSEGSYQSSSEVEVGPDGRVRTTRSESGRSASGEPFQARYESVQGPDGEFSESSHESGQRPPGAPSFDDAPIFDRARRREADSGSRGVGSPVGAPVTTSRHAREAKAGRPVVSGQGGARSATPFDAFLPGLNSDSQTEKSASIAMVLAVAGWAFCFPISLVSLYFVKECKNHALAEGRPVPQLATIATITALLNLGFMGLTCLGNVSL
jgi:hypothetical protein